MASSCPARRAKMTVLTADRAQQDISPRAVTTTMPPPPKVIWPRVSSLRLGDHWREPPDRRRRTRVGTAILCDLARGPPGQAHPSTHAPRIVELGKSVNVQWVAHPHPTEPDAVHSPPCRGTAPIAPTQPRGDTGGAEHVSATGHRTRTAARTARLRLAPTTSNKSPAGELRSPHAQGNAPDFRRARATSAGSSRSAHETMRRASAIAARRVATQGSP